MRNAPVAPKVWAVIAFIKTAISRAAAKTPQGLSLQRAGFGLKASSACGSLIYADLQRCLQVCK